MSGTREDIGVIPLAISSVFQAIEEVSSGMMESELCSTDADNLAMLSSRTRRGIIY